jgi:hypothetical protein
MPNPEPTNCLRCGIPFEGAIYPTKCFGCDFDTLCEACAQTATCCRLPNTRVGPAIARWEVRPGVIVQVEENTNCPNCGEGQVKRIGNNLQCFEEVCMTDFGTVTA